MNVPSVVKKSFEELKNRPEYMAIVQTMADALKNMTSPIQRAKVVHEVVDDFNIDVFSHQIVKDLSSCKLGCSGCCHTQVAVTEDEARLLVERIKDGISIDKNLLALQMKAKNDHTQFYQISYDDRKCIFLDENGACRVYEDRPSVCRTNAVLGSPDQCDTRTTIRPTRLIRTANADMAIYASFLEANSSGVLPYMVGELLGAKADD